VEQKGMRLVQLDILCQQYF